MSTTATPSTSWMNTVSPWYIRSLSKMESKDMQRQSASRNIVHFFRQLRSRIRAHQSLMKFALMTLQELYQQHAAHQTMPLKNIVITGVDMVACQRLFRLLQGLIEDGLMSEARIGQPLPLTFRFVTELSLDSERVKQELRYTDPAAEYFVQIVLVAPFTDATKWYTSGVIGSKMTQLFVLQSSVNSVRMNRLVDEVVRVGKGQQQQQQQQSNNATTKEILAQGRQKESRFSVAGITREQQAVASALADVETARAIQSETDLEFTANELWTHIYYHCKGMPYNPQMMMQQQQQQQQQQRAYNNKPTSASNSNASPRSRASSSGNPLGGSAGGRLGSAGNNSVINRRHSGNYPFGSSERPGSTDMFGSGPLPELIAAPEDAGVGPSGEQLSFTNYRMSPALLASAMMASTFETISPQHQQQDGVVMSGNSSMTQHPIMGMMYRNVFVGGRASSGSRASSVAPPGTTAAGGRTSTALGSTLSPLAVEQQQQQQQYHVLSAASRRHLTSIPRGLFVGKGKIILRAIRRSRWQNYVAFSKSRHLLIRPAADLVSEQNYIKLISKTSRKLYSTSGILLPLRLIVVCSRDAIAARRVAFVLVQFLCTGAGAQSVEFMQVRAEASFYDVEQATHKIRQSPHSLFVVSAPAFNEIEHWSEFRQVAANMHIVLLDENVFQMQGEQLLCIQQDRAGVLLHRQQAAACASTNSDVSPSPRRIGSAGSPPRPKLSTQQQLNSNPNIPAGSSSSVLLHSISSKTLDEIIEALELFSHSVISVNDIADAAADTAYGKCPQWVPPLDYVDDLAAALSLEHISNMLHQKADKQRTLTMQLEHTVNANNLLPPTADDSDDDDTDTDLMENHHHRKGKKGGGIAGGSDDDEDDSEIDSDLSSTSTFSDDSELERLRNAKRKRPGSRVRRMNAGAMSMRRDRGGLGDTATRTNPLTNDGSDFGSDVSSTSSFSDDEEFRASLNLKRKRYNQKVPKVFGRDWKSLSTAPTSLGLMLHSGFVQHSTLLAVTQKQQSSASSSASSSHQPSSSGRHQPPSSSFVVHLTAIVSNEKGKEIFRVEGTPSFRGSIVFDKYDPQKQFIVQAKDVQKDRPYSLSIFVNNNFQTAFAKGRIDLSQMFVAGQARKLWLRVPVQRVMTTSSKQEASSAFSGVAAGSVLLGMVETFKLAHMSTEDRNIILGLAAADGEETRSQMIAASHNTNNALLALKPSSLALSFGGNSGKNATSVIEVLSRVEGQSSSSAASASSAAPATPAAGAGASRDKVVAETVATSSADTGALERLAQFGQQHHYQVRIQRNLFAADPFSRVPLRESLSLRNSGWLMFGLVSLFSSAKLPALAIYDATPSTSSQLRLENNSNNSPQSAGTSSTRRSPPPPPPAAASSSPRYDKDDNRLEDSQISPSGSRGDGRSPVSVHDGEDEEENPDQQQRLLWCSSDHEVSSSSFALQQLASHSSLWFFNASESGGAATFVVAVSQTKRLRLVATEHTLDNQDCRREAFLDLEALAADPDANRVRVDFTPSDSQMANLSASRRGLSPAAEDDAWVLNMFVCKADYGEEHHEQQVADMQQMLEQQSRNMDQPDWSATFPLLAKGAFSQGRPLSPTSLERSHHQHRAGSARTSAFFEVGPFCVSEGGDSRSGSGTTKKKPSSPSSSSMVAIGPANNTYSSSPTQQQHDHQGGNNDNSLYVVALVGVSVPRYSGPLEVCIKAGGRSKTCMPDCALMLPNALVPFDVLESHLVVSGSDSIELSVTPTSAQAKKGSRKVVVSNWKDLIRGTGRAMVSLAPPAKGSHWRVQISVFEAAPFFPAMELLFERCQYVAELSCKRAGEATSPTSPSSSASDTSSSLSLVRAVKSSSLLDQPSSSSSSTPTTASWTTVKLFGASGFPASPRRGHSRARVVFELSPLGSLSSSSSSSSHQQQQQDRQQQQQQQQQHMVLRTRSPPPLAVLSSSDDPRRKAEAPVILGTAVVADVSRLHLALKRSQFPLKINAVYRAPSSSLAAASSPPQQSSSSGLVEMPYEGILQFDDALKHFNSGEALKLSLRKVMLLSGSHSEEQIDLPDSVDARLVIGGVLFIPPTPPHKFNLFEHVVRSTVRSVERNFRSLIEDLERPAHEETFNAPGAVKEALANRAEKLKHMRLLVFTDEDQMLTSCEYVTTALSESVVPRSTLLASREGEIAIQNIETDGHLVDRINLHGVLNDRMLTRLSESDVVTATTTTSSCATSSDSGAWRIYSNRVGVLRLPFEAPTSTNNNNNGGSITSPTLSPQQPPPGMWSTPSTSGVPPMPSGWVVLSVHSVWGIPRSSAHRDLTVSMLSHSGASGGSPQGATATTMNNINDASMLPPSQFSASGRRFSSPLDIIAPPPIGVGASPAAAGGAGGGSGGFSPTSPYQNQTPFFKTHAYIGANSLFDYPNHVAIPTPENEECTVCIESQELRWSGTIDLYEATRNQYLMVPVMVSSESPATENPTPTLPLAGGSGTQTPSRSGTCTPGAAGGGGGGGGGAAAGGSSPLSHSVRAFVLVLCNFAPYTKEQREDTARRRAEYASVTDKLNLAADELHKMACANPGPGQSITCGNFLLRPCVMDIAVVHRKAHIRNNGGLFRAHNDPDSIQLLGGFKQEKSYAVHRENVPIVLRASAASVLTELQFVDPETTENIFDPFSLSTGMLDRAETESVEVSTPVQHIEFIQTPLQFDIGTNAASLGGVGNGAKSGLAFAFVMLHSCFFLKIENEYAALFASPVVVEARRRTTRKSSSPHKMVLGDSSSHHAFGFSSRNLASTSLTSVFTSPPTTSAPGSKDQIPGAHQHPHQGSSSSNVAPLSPTLGSVSSPLIGPQHRHQHEHEQQHQEDDEPHQPQGINCRAGSVETHGSVHRWSDASRASFVESLDVSDPLDEVTIDFSVVALVSNGSKRVVLATGVLDVSLLKLAEAGASSSASTGSATGGCRNSNLRVVDVCSPVNSEFSFRGELRISLALLTADRHAASLRDRRNAALEKSTVKQRRIMLCNIKNISESSREAEEAMAKFLARKQFRVVSIDRVLVDGAPLPLVDNSSPKAMSVAVALRGAYSSRRTAKKSSSPSMTTADELDFHQLPADAPERKEHLEAAEAAIAKSKVADFSLNTRSAYGSNMSIIPAERDLQVAICSALAAENAGGADDEEKRRSPKFLNTINRHDLVDTNVSGEEIPKVSVVPLHDATTDPDDDRKKNAEATITVTPVDYLNPTSEADCREVAATLSNNNNNTNSRGEMWFTFVLHSAAGLIPRSNGDKRDVCVSIEDASGNELQRTDVVLDTCDPTFDLGNATVLLPLEQWGPLREIVVRVLDRSPAGFDAPIGYSRCNVQELCLQAYGGDGEPAGSMIQILPLEPEDIPELLEKDDLGFVRCSVGVLKLNERARRAQQEQREALRQEQLKQLEDAQKKALQNVIAAATSPELPGQLTLLSVRAAHLDVGAQETSKRSSDNKKKDIDNKKLLHTYRTPNGEIEDPLAASLSFSARRTAPSSPFAASSSASAPSAATHLAARVPIDESTKSTAGASYMICCNGDRFSVTEEKHRDFTRAGPLEIGQDPLDASTATGAAAPLSPRSSSAVVKASFAPKLRPSLYLDEERMLGHEWEQRMVGPDDQEAGEGVDNYRLRPDADDQTATSSINPPASLLCNTRPVVAVFDFEKDSACYDDERNGPAMRLNPTTGREEPVGEWMGLCLHSMLFADLVEERLHPGRSAFVTVEDSTGFVHVCTHGQSVQPMNFFDMERDRVILPVPVFTPPSETHSMTKAQRLQEEESRFVTVRLHVQGPSSSSASEKEEPVCVGTAKVELFGSRNRNTIGCRKVRVDFSTPTGGGGSSPSSSSSQQQSQVPPDISSSHAEVLFNVFSLHVSREQMRLEEEEIFRETHAVTLKLDAAASDGLKDLLDQPGLLRITNFGACEVPATVERAFVRVTTTTTDSTDHDDRLNETATTTTTNCLVSREGDLVRRPTRATEHSAVFSMSEGVFITALKKQLEVTVEGVHQTQRQQQNQNQDRELLLVDTLSERDLTMSRDGTLLPQTTTKRAYPAQYDERAARGNLATTLSLLTVPVRPTVVGMPSYRDGWYVMRVHSLSNRPERSSGGFHIHPRVLMKSSASASELEEESDQQRLLLLHTFPFPTKEGTDESESAAVSSFNHVECASDSSLAVVRCKHRRVTFQLTDADELLADGQSPTVLGEAELDLDSVSQTNRDRCLRVPLTVARPSKRNRGDSKSNGNDDDDDDRDDDNCCYIRLVCFEVELPLEQRALQHTNVGEHFLLPSRIEGGMIHQNDYTVCGHSSMEFTTKKQHHVGGQAQSLIGGDNKYSSSSSNLAVPVLSHAALCWMLNDYFPTLVMEEPGFSSEFDQVIVDSVTGEDFLLPPDDDNQKDDVSSSLMFLPPPMCPIDEDPLDLEGIETCCHFRTIHHHQHQVDESSSTNVDQQQHQQQPEHVTQIFLKDMQAAEQYARDDIAHQYIHQLLVKVTVQCCWVTRSDSTEIPCVVRYQQWERSTNRSEGVAANSNMLNASLFLLDHRFREYFHPTVELLLVSSFERHHRINIDNEMRTGRTTEMALDALGDDVQADERVSRMNIVLAQEQDWRDMMRNCLFAQNRLQALRGMAPYLPASTVLRSAASSQQRQSAGTARPTTASLALLDRLHPAGGGGKFLTPHLPTTGQQQHQQRASSAVTSTMMNDQDRFANVHRPATANNMFVGGRHNLSYRSNRSDINQDELFPVDEDFDGASPSPHHHFSDSIFKRSDFLRAEIQDYEAAGGEDDQQSQLHRAPPLQPHERILSAPAQYIFRPLGATELELAFSCTSFQLAHHHLERYGLSLDLHLLNEAIHIITQRALAREPTQGLLSPLTALFGQPKHTSLFNQNVAKTLAAAWRARYPMIDLYKDDPSSELLILLQRRQALSGGGTLLKDAVCALVSQTAMRIGVEISTSRAKRTIFNLQRVLRAERLEGVVPLSAVLSAASARADTLRQAIAYCSRKASPAVILRCRQCEAIEAAILLELTRLSRARPLCSGELHLSYESLKYIIFGALRPDSPAQVEATPAYYHQLMIAEDNNTTMTSASREASPAPRTQQQNPSISIRGTAAAGASTSQQGQQQHQASKSASPAAGRRGKSQRKSSMNRGPSEAGAAGSGPGVAGWVADQQQHDLFAPRPISAGLDRVGGGGVGVGDDALPALVSYSSPVAKAAQQSGAVLPEMMSDLESGGITCANEQHHLQVTNNNAAADDWSTMTQQYASSSSSSRHHQIQHHRSVPLRPIPKEVEPFSAYEKSLNSTMASQFSATAGSTARSPLHHHHHNRIDDLTDGRKSLFEDPFEVIFVFFHEIVMNGVASNKLSGLGGDTGKYEASCNIPWCKPTYAAISVDKMPLTRNIIVNNSGGGGGGNSSGTSTSLLKRPVATRAPHSFFRAECAFNQLAAGAFESSKYVEDLIQKTMLDQNEGTSETLSSMLNPHPFTRIDLVSANGQPQHVHTAVRLLLEAADAPPQFAGHTNPVTGLKNWMEAAGPKFVLGQLLLPRSAEVFSLSLPVQVVSGATKLAVTPASRASGVSSGTPERLVGVFSASSSTAPTSLAATPRAGGGAGRGQTLVPTPPPADERRGGGPSSSLLVGSERDVFAAGGGRARPFAPGGLAPITGTASSVSPPAGGLIPMRGGAAAASSSLTSPMANNLGNTSFTSVHDVFAPSSYDQLSPDVTAAIASVTSVHVGVGRAIALTTAAALLVRSE